MVGVLVLALFFHSLTAQEQPKKWAGHFANIWHFAPQEKLYIHTDKPYYSAGETLWFRVHLVNAATHQPTTRSQFAYVELINSSDSVVSRVKIRRDSLGMAGKIDLSPQLPADIYVLRGYTHWMQNASSDFFFYKKIGIGNQIDNRQKSSNSLQTVVNDNVPTEHQKDYDVQFFPESGVFLNNQIQTLGFKAIGTNGLSEEISGTIYNNRNEEISTFQSQHRGMGKLVLRTFPNESYYAVISNKAGVRKQVPLPQSESTGIALQMHTSRGRIYFQVLNQSKLPTDSLFLLVHVRGVVYLTYSLTDSVGHLSENLLPTGIASFAIIDSQGNTYCERLVFVRHGELPTTTLTPNNIPSERRKQVHLTLNIKNAGNTQPNGSYSVSITNQQWVKPDSTGNHIVSYLLLTSDLKGHIENPQDYFKDHQASTREKADILMLTQGWRRFCTANLVKGIMPNNKYFMEVGQSLTGQVLNLFNKPSKNNVVLLLSGYKNQIRTTNSDSLGRFLFEGIEFPDSTPIILKAHSRSRLVDVALQADGDSFPKATLPIPRPGIATPFPNNEYLLFKKERYYYEGGMMVVNLDEITVEAQAQNASTEFYYSGLADRSFNAEKLKEFAGMMLFDILAMFPGVEVSGDRVSIRGGGSPLFLIDGIETDQVDHIKYLNTSDIENISLFRGASASIFGAKGGNGAIAIALKKGAIIQRATPPSLLHITPLGFQKPVAFYVPKYEVDSVRLHPAPDMRTTLFWNPKATPDSNGNIHLSFYTADQPGNYRIELEGVSNSGEITHFQGVLRRK